MAGSRKAPAHRLRRLSLPAIGIVCVLVALGISTRTCADSVCGDITCDRQVTAIDALRVLRAAVHSTDLVKCPRHCPNLDNTETNFQTCGDYTGDGLVTATDALLVLRAAVGLSQPQCTAGICGNETVDGCRPVQSSIVGQEACLPDAATLNVDLETAPTGTTVVVWSAGVSGGNPDDTSTDLDIVALRIDAEGQRTTTVPVNDYGADDRSIDTRPSVVYTREGRWIITWASNFNIYGDASTDFDLFYSVSDDDGRSWSPARPLDPRATAAAGRDDFPDLAVDMNAGRIIAVWASSRSLGAQDSDDSDLLYSVSDDNGRTWSDPRALFDSFLEDSVDKSSPRITTDGAGGWLVIWTAIAAETNNPILHAATSHSPLFGWSPVILSEALPGSVARFPQAAPRGQDSWTIVYQLAEKRPDGILGPSRVVESFSGDGGSTFSAPTLVGLDTPPGSVAEERVSLAHGGQGSLHLAYHERVRDGSAPTRRVRGHSTLPGTWSLLQGADDIDSVTNPQTTYLSSSPETGRLAIVRTQPTEAGCVGNRIQHQLSVDIHLCEACDSSEPVDGCKTDCTKDVCGDGIVGGSEVCDPAATDTEAVCEHACSVRREFDSIRFKEITLAAGIRDSKESWGTAIGDFDGDGWEDIWLTNHRFRPYLFRNGGDGRFREIRREVWFGTGGSRDTHGATWADIDNDGDLDLIESVGGGNGGLALPNHVFQNDDGILTEMAEVFGLTYPEGRGRGSTWFDADGDQYLDGIFSNLLREDLVAPSGLFTHDGDGWVQSNEEYDIPLSPDSRFAQLCELDGDNSPELALHSFSYPLDIFDTSTKPYRRLDLDFDPSRRNDVSDVVIADFDNDLDNDILVVRERFAGEVQAISPNSIAAAFRLGGGTEKSLVLKTTGRITIVFDSPFFWPIELLSVGHLGQVPTSRTVQLDPENPQHHGVQPHRGGQDTGVYMGYETDDGQWRIDVSALTTTGGPESGGPLNAVILTEEPDVSFVTEDFTADPPEFPPLLFINSGTGSSREFVDEAEQRGLEEPMHCHSAVAADFDNDMDIDIYFACRSKTRNLTNKLFLNDGSGRFQRSVDAGGAQGSERGISDAIALFDYDKDGFIDLFVTNGDGSEPFNQLGPTHLYRNRGNENYWIGFDLTGGPSNREARGARVFVTVGDVVQIREPACLEIHDSAQNSRRVHFGVGGHEIVDAVRIEWPDGAVTEFAELEVNRSYSVAQP